MARVRSIRDRRGRRWLTIVMAGLACVGSVAPVSASAQTYKRGIDVSNWQGSIAWGKVAAAGYSFAFAKATDGLGYNDPYYPANRRGAKSNGLHFGAYHFAEPSGSNRDAIRRNAHQQADHFLSFADPQPGELLPVLDLERDYDPFHGGYHLTTSQLITWTQAWLNRVQSKLGVHAIIYSGPYFWRTQMGDTQRFADEGYDVLWVPSWGVSSPSVQAGNWGGDGWTFWQYSDGSDLAPVPGAGHVDHDYYRYSSFGRVSIPSPDTLRAPVDTSPPAITGSPFVGNTLAASTGQWSGGPTRYAYSWLRCDAAGANCSKLQDATASRYTLRRGDYRHTLRVAVTAYNGAGSVTARSAATPVVGDDTAPTPPLVRASSGAVTVADSFDVSWSSTDDASGVSSYDVFYRVAAPRRPFGDPIPLATGTRATSLSFSAQRGRTYCFWATATDAAANKSAAGPQDCTTTPKDDVQLHSDQDWRRVSGQAGFYRETYSQAATPGYRLRKWDVTVRRITVVAERCPTCGSVRVRFAGHDLADLDLRSATTAVVRMPVARFAHLRTGTFKLITEGGGRVRIDGVALGRR